MIENLLTPENCRQMKSVTDWKDAIHTALIPLQEGGWCTDEYEDSVLENTEKFGPYYVLCPQLALIHAGFEKGVNGTQMAVTVLEQPVRFSEDGPDVRVLVPWRLLTGNPIWKAFGQRPISSWIRPKLNPSSPRRTPVIFTVCSWKTPDPASGTDRAENGERRVETAGLYKEKDGLRNLKSTAGILKSLL